MEFSLKYHLNGERGWDVGILGKSKWVLGEMNGPLEEQMGGIIVCDTVCLGVVLTSILLSCDESQSSVVDETPREEICDN